MSWGGEKTNQDGLDHFPRCRIQVDAKYPGPETDTAKSVVDTYVSDLRIVQMVRTNTQGASGS